VQASRKNKVLVDLDKMAADEDEEVDVDPAVTEMYQNLVKELGEKEANPLFLGSVCEFSQRETCSYSTENIGTAVRIQRIVEFCFKDATEQLPGVVPLVLEIVSEKTQEKQKLKVKEFRARLCADLCGLLVHDRRKQNVARARHRILVLVTHHKVTGASDSDGIQKLGLQIYAVVEQPDKQLDGKPYVKPECTSCGGECQAPDVHFPVEVNEPKPEDQTDEAQDVEMKPVEQEEVSEELQRMMADSGLVFKDKDEESNEKKVKWFF